MEADMNKPKNIWRGGYIRTAQITRPKIVISLAWVAILTCSSGMAAASDVFRCVIDETRYLSEDGRQITFPKEIYKGDTILADTASGLVRFVSNRYQFAVIQHATAQNGWILARVLEGPAATSVMLLAIKTFNPERPFMFTDAAMVHSGKCSIVQ